MRLFHVPNLGRSNTMRLGGPDVVFDLYKLYATSVVMGLTDEEVEHALNFYPETGNALADYEDDEDEDGNASPELARRNLLDAAVQYVLDARVEPTISVIEWDEEVSTGVSVHVAKSDEWVILSVTDDADDGAAQELAMLDECGILDVTVEEVAAFDLLAKARKDLSLTSDDEVALGKRMAEISRQQACEDIAEITRDSESELLANVAYMLRVRTPEDVAEVLNFVVDSDRHARRAEPGEA